MRKISGFEQCDFTINLTSPNVAGGMANGVDPDQTEGSGAVWSGSTLFALTCLFKCLGSFQYVAIIF